MSVNTKEDFPSFSDVLPPDFLAMFTWMVQTKPTHHLKFRSQSRKPV